MSWHPETYLRYREQRDRPFRDLLAQLPVEPTGSVVDLGCGTGHLTAGLADRWPTATVHGIDSSPEMISVARALGARVNFAVADLRDWRPDRSVQVVVSNAALQWVPEHQSLLLRWAGELSAGAFLAVAVPGNFDAPSHRALRDAATDPRWRRRLEPVLRHSPVLDAAGYAALLHPVGCTVDAWETTYLHVLPPTGDGTHPVLEWMAGTALRPVRAALADAGEDWPRFTAVLARRLAEDYPRRPDGSVYLPFRRVFFVARKGAGTDRPQS